MTQENAFLEIYDHRTIYPNPLRLSSATASASPRASAAVVLGRRALSNVVASQAQLHAKWGGIVPEAAARALDAERPRDVELRIHLSEAAEFLRWLDGKIARWWMPDEVLIVDEIPLGATGKIDKKSLV